MKMDYGLWTMDYGPTTRKKILLITIGLIWGFWVWFLIHHERGLFLKQEIQKADLLAQNLAASSAPPLQSGLEPLASVKEILTHEGVVNAWVSSTSQAPPPAERENRHTLRIEKQIIGLDGRNLGQAVLIYRPKAPHFYFLWVLVFIPLAAPIFLKFRQSPAGLETSPKEKEIYPWLPTVRHFLKKKIYVFDSKGNILASSEANPPAHLLDLFPNPLSSQKILAALDQLLKGEKTNVPLGFWRNHENEARFLLACH